jgi:hypothetical protein
MAMYKKITNFFNISDETNPLMVEATINAQLEEGGWVWEVEAIHRIELVVGDKEGIDITKQIFSNPRALALVTSQVKDLDEQAYEALANSKTAA